MKILHIVFNSSPAQAFAMDHPHTSVGCRCTSEMEGTSPQGSVAPSGPLHHSCSKVPHTHRYWSAAENSTR
ncbi:hypothetical protein BDR03DRAFT_937890 [Suillus americanus]|nr:hypothetical protein BDR03DRAFT_937890 [Suillus americanus]